MRAASSEHIFVVGIPKEGLPGGSPPILLLIPGNPSFGTTVTTEYNM